MYSDFSFKLAELKINLVAEERAGDSGVSGSQISFVAFKLCMIRIHYDFVPFLTFHPGKNKDQHWRGRTEQGTRDCQSFIVADFLCRYKTIMNMTSILP